jgi:hypothetical protein
MFLAVVVSLDHLELQASCLGRERTERDRKLDVVGLRPTLPGDATNGSTDLAVHNGDRPAFGRENVRKFPERAERGDFLSRIAHHTFTRITTGTLPGPARLGAVLGGPVSQQRLLAHSFHPDEQALFERLGLAGSFAPGGGDVFAVVHANANPSKIDSYLRRELSYEATIEPRTGRVSAAVRIQLSNDAPSSGLPAYVLGSHDQDLPPGTNHLSIYSRLDLDLASIEGTDAPIEHTAEYGLNRYSIVVDVPAESTRSVELRLSGALDLSQGYALAVPTQPLVNTDRLRVTLTTVGDAANSPEVVFDGEHTTDLVIRPRSVP